jgi:hypothetical protein
MTTLNKIFKLFFKYDIIYKKLESGINQKSAFILKTLSYFDAMTPAFW